MIITVVSTFNYNIETGWMVQKSSENGLTVILSVLFEVWKSDVDHGSTEGRNNSGNGLRGNRSPKIARIWSILS